ncbi:MAG TPA: ABC transporter ATP-binding protein [Syntrophorhabdales bacterium]|nr:ABC transporter ATP-binding protein [Syntrophorhabdales bacterium]
MLSIKHMDAFYGNVQVLFDVDITVGAGELVSIIGPNSAGKSTLLKAVLGLVSVNKGRQDSAIVFDGNDVGSIPTEKIIARGMSIVPEGGRVFPDMSLYDNLYLGGYTKHEKIEETIEQVFELFPQLRERMHQQAKTLSGGERQMLAIGRALMSRPKLMLLDEPSLGLQPSMVIRIFEIIRKVHEQGVAVLLVEQNVNQTLAITQRTYVLEAGRVALEGRSDELMGNGYIKKAYLAI